MILTILFIVLIGQAYYNLANRYKRNKWGYAVLGPAIYICSMFMYGIVYGIVYVILYPEVMEDPYFTFEGNWWLELSGFAVALFLSWLVYYLLERSWKKNRRPGAGYKDINDIGGE